MQVSTLAQNLLVKQTVSRLQTNLLTAQNQLSTGKKSDTFQGLEGTEASRSLSLRQDLNRIDQYERTISITEMRLEIMQTTFSRLDATSEDIALDAMTGAFENTERLPTLQYASDTYLQEVLGMLNRTVDGRFLFSGSTTTQPAVEDLNTILNGDRTTGRIGFLKQIENRQLADQVADTVRPGGLEVTYAGAGNPVVVTDVRTDGFGFQLTDVTTTSGTLTVTKTPTASDFQVDIDNFGALNDGDEITLHVTLPDGEQRPITLIATGDLDDTRPNTFYAGGTADQVAAAFKSELDKVLAEEASTHLKTASIIAAAEGFFGTTPPQIVNDPTGTPSLVTDSETNPQAVWWYGGSQGTDPRSELRSKIEDGTTVEYGVRADEVSIRQIVTDLAIFTAVPYDQAEEDMFKLLADKVGRHMHGANGALEDLIGEIGSKQETVESVRVRHDSLSTLTNNQLYAVENVDLYEVSTQILAYETQLQASYEVTSRLQSLSLVNALRF